MYTINNCYIHIYDIRIYIMYTINNCYIHIYVVTYTKSIYEAVLILKIHLSSLLKIYT